MDMTHDGIMTAVLVAMMSITVVHAEETNTNRVAIVYGLERANIVLSGITQGSAAGGGGVTSQLKVEEVFMGKDELKGKVITVFWLTDKGSEDGKNIWFLKPHDQGYQEAVGTKFPFVEAAAENVTFLKSCIQKKQKPNQASQDTSLRADPER